MSEAAVAAKFDFLAGLALRPAAVAALGEALRQIDTMSDCAVLDVLLTGDAPSGPVKAIRFRPRPEWRRISVGEVSKTW